MGLFNSAANDKAENPTNSPETDVDDDQMERGDDHERNDSVTESIYTPAAALNEQRTDSLSDSVETANELERRSTAGTIALFSLEVSLFLQILLNLSFNPHLTIN